jgi:glycosyltransferase involved in cell wall biosynthesis
MLKGCLDSLLNQTLDKKKYELIVVDNNSTDNTRQVVEDFQDKGNIGYYMELRQGLSFARNHGLKTAQGEYIAYIDDDALAASDWLEVAYGLIKTLKPFPDCLGGPIFPFYTSPKPTWFTDEYEIRRDWSESKYLKRGESFSGSNMIWKKDSLQSIEGFDVQMGVKGDILMLGEETLSFEKIWHVRKNPQLYYSPALIIHHWVPDFKLTVTYRLRRAFAVGQFLGRPEMIDHNSNRLVDYVLSMKILLKTICKSLFKLPHYNRWENWAVENLDPVMAEVGKLMALLHLFPPLKHRD